MPPANATCATRMIGKTCGWSYPAWMTRFLPLGLLALLAACGTPQQQCIARGSGDLRVVDRLIAETEGNLARGYGYENVSVSRPQWVNCTPHPTPENPMPERKLCFDEVTTTSREAVALDLNAEAAKLASLRPKRAALNRAALIRVDQCKAQYPE